MAYGMLGSVGVSRQAAFGTANVTSVFWIPVQNESLSEAIPPLIKEAMTGRFEEGDTFEGAHEITGDILSCVHPIDAGVFCKAWFGQSSGTTAGDSAYSHSFKGLLSDFDDNVALPPYTIEAYRDAGSAHQYYDMQAEGFVVNIANGALQQFTSTWIGGKFAKAEKGTPAYLEGSEYTWDQTSVSIAGVAQDGILDLTVTGANALENVYTLGGVKTPGRTKRSGFRTIVIAGTLLFENDTEFDNFRLQVEQRLVVSTIGHEVSSGVNAEFIMDFPSMRFDTFPANIGGPGLIQAAFSARAVYNDGSGTMAEFTLVNSQESY